MAEYPTKSGSKKSVNYPVGHKGIVTDSGIEGRPNESTKTIRGGSVKGKKGAGNVGASNVNHSA